MCRSSKEAKSSRRGTGRLCRAPFVAAPRSSGCDTFPPRSHMLRCPLARPLHILRAGLLFWGAANWCRGAYRRGSESSAADARSPAGAKLFIASGFNLVAVPPARRIMRLWRISDVGRAGAHAYMMHPLDISSLCFSCREVEISAGPRKKSARPRQSRALGASNGLECAERTSEKAAAELNAALDARRSK